MRRLTSVQHAVQIASGMSSHYCQKNKGNLTKNIVFVKTTWCLFQNLTEIWQNSILFQSLFQIVFLFQIVLCINRCFNFCHRTLPKNRSLESHVLRQVLVVWNLEVPYAVRIYCRMYTHRHWMNAGALFFLVYFLYFFLSHNCPS